MKKSRWLQGMLWTAAVQCFHDCCFRQSFSFRFCAFQTSRLGGRERFPNFHVTAVAVLRHIDFVWILADIGAKGPGRVASTFPKSMPGPVPARIYLFCGASAAAWTAPTRRWSNDCVAWYRMLQASSGAHGHLVVLGSFLCQLPAMASARGTVEVSF